MRLGITGEYFFLCGPGKETLFLQLFLHCFLVEFRFLIVLLLVVNFMLYITFILLCTLRNRQLAVYCL